MVALLIRGLLIIAIVVAAVYFLYRLYKKINLTDERREKIDTAKINIAETKKEASTLPEVDSNKLKKDRKKVNGFLNEGEKNKGGK